MYSHVQPYRPIAPPSESGCIQYAISSTVAMVTAWAVPPEAHSQPHHTLKTSSQEEEFDVLP